jgi:hypothetical protein
MSLSCPDPPGPRLLAKQTHANKKRLAPQCEVIVGAGLAVKSRPLFGPAFESYASAKADAVVHCEFSKSALAAINSVPHLPLPPDASPPREMLQNVTNQEARFPLQTPFPN